MFHFQVTETEIAQLTARLSSLSDSQHSAPSPDPALDTAVDRLIGEVAELEAQRALALPRPDAGTAGELETREAGVLVRRGRDYDDWSWDVGL